MTTPFELEKLAAMYQLAKADESQRDSFIEEVAHAFSELYHKGVSEIIYDPAGREYNDYALQLCKEKIITSKAFNELEPGLADSANFAVLAPFSRMGRGDRFPIFVTKNAFKINSLDEFLNILVDHETVHTKDLMDGINIGDTFFLTYKNTDRLRFGALCAITEVRADENMLAKARIKGLNGTEGYFRRKNRMLDKLQKLKDINKSAYNKFEEYVTLIFLDEFYQREQQRTT